MSDQQRNEKYRMSICLWAVRLDENGNVTDSSDLLEEEDIGQDSYPTYASAAVALNFLRNPLKNDDEHYESLSEFKDWLVTTHDEWIDDENVNPDLVRGAELVMDYLLGEVDPKLGTCAVKGCKSRTHRRWTTCDEHRSSGFRRN